MPRRSPRPRTLAVGALALILAVAPFVPHGGGDEGAIRPSGDGKVGALGARPAGTAGPSRITPAMQREIDRVVAAGQRSARAVSGRAAGKATPEQLAASLVRCADLDGQRYCLGSGWTESAPSEVRARVAAAARTAPTRRGPGRPETTGDLSPAAALLRTARMSPAARAASERRELTAAARAVGKVWLLRHEIEGVPLPAGFLAAHPEARAVAPARTPQSGARSGTRSGTRSGATAAPSPTATPTPASVRTTVKRYRDYPRRATVLDPVQTSEQTEYYWCGPTTMQMIVWGWRKRRQTQAHWAHQLGTTTSGTAITDMVRVVNRATGWDNARRAGPYIVLDIGDYTFRKWKLLIMRHIHDYRAPVVLHPILLKRFYPYLDDDASGHFQVGRGYRKAGKRPDLLGYFEPWNQQRFDPSEPYIDRVQWRDAYRSYRANEAHFAHNIGV